MTTTSLAKPNRLVIDLTSCPRTCADKLGTAPAAARIAVCLIRSDEPDFGGFLAIHDAVSFVRMHRMSLRRRPAILV